MQPLTGPRWSRSCVARNSGPLALVPAMIMSVRAKPASVEEALRAGAHQVLVLPISASTLYRRLAWLINDDRPFELKGEYYVVARHGAAALAQHSASGLRPGRARPSAAGLYP